MLHIFREVSRADHLDVKSLSSLAQESVRLNMPHSIVVSSEKSKMVLFRQEDLKILMDFVVKMKTCKENQFIWDAYFTKDKVNGTQVAYLAENMGHSLYSRKEDPRRDMIHFEEFQVALTLGQSLLHRLSDKEDGQCITKGMRAEAAQLLLDTKFSVIPPIFPKVASECLGYIPTNLEAIASHDIGPIIIKLDGRLEAVPL